MLSTRPRPVHAFHHAAPKRLFHIKRHLLPHCDSHAEIIPPLAPFPELPLQLLLAEARFDSRSRDAVGTLLRTLD
jgi:hypothetical protein